MKKLLRFLIATIVVLPIINIAITTKSFSASLDPQFYWNCESTTTPQSPQVGTGQIVYVPSNGGGAGTMTISSSMPTGMGFMNGHINPWANYGGYYQLNTTSNFDPDAGEMTFSYRTSKSVANASGVGAIFSSTGTTDARMYFSGIGTNPPYPVYFYLNTLNNVYVQTSGWTADIGTGRTYSFRLVWNRVASVAEVWIDGVKYSGAIQNAGSWSSIGASYLAIGNDRPNNSSYRFLYGTLDEFYVGIPSAPVNVRDLTALPGTNPGSINLGWTTPGDDGTGNDLVAGSQFAIHYSTNPSTTWAYTSANLIISTAVTAGINVNWTVSNLVRGATYYFRIWTADEMGNWSGICLPGATSYATPDSITPNPITGLTGLPGTNSGEINLTWTSTGDDGANGDFETGSRYEIMVSSWVDTSNIAAFYASTRSLSQYTPIPAVSTAKTVTQVVVTGLTSGATYWFAIRTLDEQPNISILSNGATCYAQLDVTPPNQITNLTALRGEYEDTLFLSWTDTGDDGSTNDFSGGGTIDIRYSSGPINNNNCFVFSSTPIAAYCSSIPTPLYARTHHFLMLTGLNHGATYYFAMKLYDEVGNPSTLSNGATNWAMTDVIAPSSFTITQFGLYTSSITLTWTSPGDNGTTGALTGAFWIKYTSYAAITDDTVWNTANYSLVLPTTTTNGSPNKYTITGLLTDLTYYIALKTCDEVPNWSPIGNCITAKTVDNVLPGRINTLSALPGYYEGELYLNWNAPGDDGTFGTPLVVGSYYFIQGSTDPLAIFSVGSAVSLSTFGVTPGVKETILITGLPPGVTYYVRIWTSDEWGNISLISNGATNYTALDIIPPAQITDLSGTSGTDNGQLNLTWTATGDDIYNVNFTTGTISAFDIRYSTNIALSPAISTAAFIAALSINPYCALPMPATAQWQYGTTLTGLSAGTTYYFAMKLRDDRGNISVLSNGATVWSFGDSTAPDPVTDLVATRTGAVIEGMLILTWTSTGDDGTVKDFPGGSGYDIRYSSTLALSPAISNANFTSARSITDFIGIIPVPSSATFRYSVTLTGLTGGVTYYFALKSYDEVPNTSLLSNGATCYAQIDVTPPGDILDLSASIIRNTYIQLSWTAPGNDGTTGTAASYLVKYSTSEITALNFSSAGNPAETEPAPSVYGTTETMDISGLSERTTYWFAIKTIDYQGNWSGISNILQKQTQDYTKPLVLSYFPSNYARGIAISTKPCVYLNEDMQVNSIDATTILLTAVKDELGNTISENVPTNPTYTSATRRIEVVLAGGASLEGNHTYELIIGTGTGIKDKSTNAMTAITYTFTTAMDNTVLNVVYSEDRRFILNIPAGKLPANSYVTISTNPVTAPLKVTPAVITAANAKILADADVYSSVAAESIVEIVVYDSANNQYTGADLTDITLTLAYNDTNNDGIVDNAAVPMREKTLRPYVLNEVTQTWDLLSKGDYNTTGNTVNVDVPHFSVFALIGCEDTDLTNAIAYPVPFKGSRGDTVITFKNVGSVATIKIYNLLGELVKTIEEDDGDGITTWPAENETNEKLGSGIYFYFIENTKETKKGKLLIVK